MTNYFTFLLLSSFSIFAWAGKADVVDVKVRAMGGDNYQVITTVRHEDTGWKHYANSWEVVDEKGNVLGKRVLHHPHENEQPFTRSHSVKIPQSVKVITVRANDLVHGGGGKEIKVKVPR